MLGHYIRRVVYFPPPGFRAVLRINYLDYNVMDL